MRSVCRLWVGNISPEVLIKVTADPYATLIDGSLCVVHGTEHPVSLRSLETGHSNRRDFSRPVDVVTKDVRKYIMKDITKDVTKVSMREAATLGPTRRPHRLDRSIVKGHFRSCQRLYRVCQRVELRTQCKLAGPPQHFLNFLPLPQGHSSLRPALA